MQRECLYMGDQVYTYDYYNFSRITSTPFFTMPRAGGLAMVESS